MCDGERDARDRLARTWKALMARLEDYDFPPQVVFETLAEVATGGMAERFGPSATAHMLRLRADAIEAEEHERVQSLVVGGAADPAVSPAPTSPALPAGGFEGPRSAAADADAARDLIGRP